MCPTIILITCLVVATSALPQDFQPADTPIDYYDELPPIQDPPKSQIQIQVPKKQQQQRTQSASSNHRFSGNENRQTAGSFVCPEAVGTFADQYQCDKYYECEDFQAYEKLCDDGLVFDHSKGNAGHADPCDSPYVVDCTDRPELQEPTFLSEYCPRRHGLFADPIPSVCNVFYTCIKGQHSVTSCATGLHFDESTGTCTWPTIAKRAGCEESVADRTINGFTCPSGEVINDQGVKIPHPTYANNDDCAKFYVCLNGVKPQEASCNIGKVFNSINGMCDYTDNVPECAKYYENYDYIYEDESFDANPASQTGP